MPKPIRAVLCFYGSAILLTFYSIISSFCIEAYKISQMVLADGAKIGYVVTSHTTVFLTSVHTLHLIASTLIKSNLLLVAYDRCRHLIFLRQEILPFTLEVYK